MDIGIALVGDRRVALRFDKFPERVHSELLERITALTEKLRDRVIAAEPERTGKLKAHTTSSIEDRATRIVGRVTITGEFGKAGALEYGAHATTRVKAHLARLDHVFGKMIEPTMVMVAAHSRHVNIAEHKFLRGPLAAMQEEIIESLRQALITVEQADAA